jgi:hypothetical protein
MSHKNLRLKMAAVYRIEKSSQEGDNSSTLILCDDDTQLCVKKLSPNDTVFRIYTYDNLTKANYELADYQKGKYTIFNETLFNLYFIGKLKDNPRLARSFHNFIVANQPGDFKEFNVRFRCFKRRINIKVIRLLRLSLIHI